MIFSPILKAKAQFSVVLCSTFTFTKIEAIPVRIKIYHVRISIVQLSYYTINIYSLYVHTNVCNVHVTIQLYICMIQDVYFSIHGALWMY